MNKTTVAQPAKTTSFIPPVQGILQRKCACGNHTAAGGECTECAKNKSRLQRKLAIGASNDPLEQEADRVANQVMAASPHSVTSGALPRIQRYTKQATEGMDTAPASVDRVLSSSGRPLEPVLRQDMEQRFGHDFSQVRVHTGGAAEQSARDVNAQAYTVGNNVVFGAGRFAPETNEGRHLIAHELTHVVQQSGSDWLRTEQRNETSVLPSIVRGQFSNSPLVPPIIQRWPGDGMSPPGDCSWTIYTPLRAAVEVTKAIVNSLGACNASDSCAVLAEKLAAITAEITARVALNTTCFKGGDTGHREAVNIRVNMLNRCWRHFSNMNCPELLAAAALAALAAAAVEAIEVVEGAAEGVELVDLLWLLLAL